MLVLSSGRVIISTYNTVLKCWTLTTSVLTRIMTESKSVASSCTSNPSLYSSPEACAAASIEAASGIADDLPLMMFGSGDVMADDVDEESVKLLAELTTNYVANLVSAAVDAHEIYTDGKGYIAPTTMYTAKGPKRQCLGLLDNDPLCAGLDFGTYNPKPKSSTAIDTKSFIFPICHDAKLYGKVLDIQSARREIGPELMDKTLLDTIRDELGEDATFPSSEGGLLPFYRLEEL